MAILKHIASKNANYGSAIDYLKYQHDEFHLVPVLDENGNMMLRDEFYLEGLNCDPETFDLECELLNQEYNKNSTYDEINYQIRKSSVPPKLHCHGEQCPVFAFLSAHRQAAQIFAPAHSFRQ